MVLAMIFAFDVQTADANITVGVFAFRNITREVGWVCEKCLQNPLRFLGLLVTKNIKYGVYINKLLITL